jgi:hypothetical protein
MFFENILSTKTAMVLESPLFKIIAALYAFNDMNHKVDENEKSSAFWIYLAQKKTASVVKLPLFRILAALYA